MAVAKAKLRFYRQSPKKVRQVVNVLRGLDVIAAERQLEVLPKRAARTLQKLLESAVANAENREEEKDKVTKDRLYISDIRVDQGPTYKRFRARAHGRAGMIRKRTSHISLVLDERTGKAKQAEETDIEKKATDKKANKADRQIKKVAKKLVKKEVKKKS